MCHAFLLELGVVERCLHGWLLREAWKWLHNFTGCCLFSECGVCLNYTLFLIYMCSYHWCFAGFRPGGGEGKMREEEREGREGDTTLHTIKDACYMYIHMYMHMHSYP